MSDKGSRRIHGVDFSGAQNAGEKIWISSGNIEGDSLVIEECRSATDEFGATDRETVLERISQFIKGRDDCVFGLDFSFGVPHELVGTDDWEEFVRTFFKHTDAETMQETYSNEARELTDGERAHLKRETDGKTGARSPYGFIPYKQTFYGIRDVLAPLVRDGEVSVLPMQSAKPDRPWAIEIYPAATLDQFGLCRNDYKEDTEASRKRRKRNLDGLLECAGGELRGNGIRATAIEDSEGDALDSLVAAVATFRAVRNGLPPVDEASYPEGHIYV